MFWIIFSLFLLSLIGALLSSALFFHSRSVHKQSWKNADPGSIFASLGMPFYGIITAIFSIGAIAFGLILYCG